MHSLLHALLQDLGALGLREVAALEDLCGIDPVVIDPPHYGCVVDGTLIHLGLDYVSIDARRVSAKCP